MKIAGDIAKLVGGRPSNAGALIVVLPDASERYLSTWRFGSDVLVARRAAGPDRSFVY